MFLLKNKTKNDMENPLEGRIEWFSTRGNYGMISPSATGGGAEAEPRPSTEGNDEESKEERGGVQDDAKQKTKDEKKKNGIFVHLEGLTRASPIPGKGDKMRYFLTYDDIGRTKAVGAQVVGETRGYDREGRLGEERKMGWLSWLDVEARPPRAGKRSGRRYYAYVDK